MRFQFPAEKCLMFKSKFWWSIRLQYRRSLKKRRLPDYLNRAPFVQFACSSKFRDGMPTQNQQLLAILSSSYFRAFHTDSMVGALHPSWMLDRPPTSKRRLRRCSRAATWKRRRHSKHCTCLQRSLVQSGALRLAIGAGSGRCKPPTAADEPHGRKNCTETAAALQMVKNQLQNTEPPKLVQCTIFITVAVRLKKPWSMKNRTTCPD